MPQSLSDIKLPWDPDVPLEAATKQYVDGLTVQEVVLQPDQPAADPRTAILWIDSDSEVVGAQFLPLTGGNMTGPLLLATAPALASEAATKQYVDTAAKNASPVGTVIQFAGPTAPTGWLLCDGTAVSRTTYALLYAVIGTIYGAGDGSTTFNLPNMKGKVPTGLDATQTEFDALGESGGAKTVTLDATMMPAHLHIQTAHNHTQSGHTHTSAAHTHAGPSHTHTATTASSSHTHSIPNHASVSSSGSGDLEGWGSGSSTVRAINTGSTGHTHTLTTAASGTAATGSTTPGASGSTTAVCVAATAVNQNTGGGLAHNNLSPYLVMNYLIAAGV